MSDQSHLFSMDANVTYINCAYMSPQLKSVEAAGIEAVKRKSHPWKYRVSDFFDPCDQARTSIAAILGAKPTDIALIPSVSYGIEVAAQNIAVEDGHTILLLDEQFPSNVYPWMALEAYIDCDVRFVKRRAGQSWADAVLDAYDPSVVVISVPNVHWTDGSLVDLNRIAASINREQTALVLDLTQSLGAMPFSVAECPADFIVAAAYKWLLGPYGMSFLYVSPDFQDGEPIEHNWINRADSEQFGGLVNYKQDYQPGALRFDMGERSQFALMPMVNTALDQILEWGVETIAAYTGKLTGHLAERARAVGLQVPSESDRAPHMAGIDLGKSVPESLMKALIDQNIFVSARGTKIRVSPHMYNSEKDIDRFMDALAAIQSS